MAAMRSLHVVELDGLIDKHLGSGPHSSDAPRP